jgi:hypothetical protein
MNIMKTHDLLRHCSEDMTQLAAKLMGWVLSGKWKPCESCATVKAKQKNVPKESKHQAATKGENHIFLNIVTVKKAKDGPNVTKPNWRIMVDERTGLKFSDFFEAKKGMIVLTCAQWHWWKTVGLTVKYL